MTDTTCFIYYRKYILQITQPSKYRCTQLQYRFAVISEAPSIWFFISGIRPDIKVDTRPADKFSIRNKNVIRSNSVTILPDILQI